MLPAGSLLHVRLDDRRGSRMNKTACVVSTVCVLFMSVGLIGQGPPAVQDASQPGFDISGYWTAALHEDAVIGLQYEVRIGAAHIDANARHLVLPP